MHHILQNIKQFIAEKFNYHIAQNAFLGCICSLILYSCQSNSKIFLRSWLTSKITFVQITRRDEGISPFISVTKQSYVFGGICSVAAFASIKVLFTYPFILLYSISFQSASEIFTWSFIFSSRPWLRHKKLISSGSSKYAGTL